MIRKKPGNLRVISLQILTSLSNILIISLRRRRLELAVRNSTRELQTEIRKTELMMASAKDTIFGDRVLSRLNLNSQLYS
jgi:hypothetical protein